MKNKAASREKLLAVVLDKESSPLARGRAVGILDEVGDPKTLQRLGSALASGQLEAPELQAAVLRSLSRSDALHGSAKLEFVHAFFHQSSLTSREVKLAVAFALREGTDAKSREILAELLKDDDPAVFDAACLSLSDVNRRRKGGSPGAMEILLEGALVFVDAVDAAILKTLQERAQEPNEGIRSNAHAVLNQYRDLYGKRR